MSNTCKCRDYTALGARFKIICNRTLRHLHRTNKRQKLIRLYE